MVSVKREGKDQSFVRNLGDGAQENSSLGAAQSDRDNSARLLIAVKCCSASLISAVNEISSPISCHDFCCPV